MTAKILCCACWLLCVPWLVAQADDKAGFSALHRFDDDFTYLSDPTQRREPWDVLKHIHLGDGSWLSLGGELRERLENFDHPDLGLSGLARDDYLLQRILLHVDAHFGDTMRGFLQLGDHSERGRAKGPSPTDQDHLDIQQGFVELMGGTTDQRLGVRLGRQELAFGSQRLVSVREAPNIRASYDGARLYSATDAWRIDAFAARPVLIREGAFDDIANTHQSFWGAYATHPMAAFPNTRLDIYYLGLNRDSARFDVGRGVEHRHTLGSRWAGTIGDWTIDFEGAIQFGRFAGGKIAAWSLWSNTHYAVRGLPLSPRLGLMADIASGDSDRHDKTLNTFNPLFPRGSNFTDASINAPANYADVYPSIELTLNPRLTASLGRDFIWRQSTHDAFYAQPLTPLVPGISSNERYVGSQGQLKFVWQPSVYASVTLSLVHFAAGDFVKAAGGRNTEYAGAWTTFRF